MRTEQVKKLAYDVKTKNTQVLVCLNAVILAKSVKIRWYHVCSFLANSLREQVKKLAYGVKTQNMPQWSHFGQKCQIH